MDDGVDYMHPDLKNNFVRQLSLFFFHTIVHRTPRPRTTSPPTIHSHILATPMIGSTPMERGTQLSSPFLHFFNRQMCWRNLSSSWQWSVWSGSCLRLQDRWNQNARSAIHDRSHRGHSFSLFSLTLRSFRPTQWVTSRTRSISTLLHGDQLTMERLLMDQGMQRWEPLWEEWMREEMERDPSSYGHPETEERMMIAIVMGKKDKEMSK